MDIQSKLIRIDINDNSHGSFIDSEYVLHIIFKGSFIFQNQQKSYSIEPNDLILIPPYKLHALQNVKDVYMMVIHFYEHSKILEGYNLPNVISLDDTSFAHVKQLCDLLMDIKESSTTRKDEVYNGLVHSIIGYFIQNSNFSNKKTSANRQFFNWKSIQLAVTYIQEHFTDPNITIAQVSDHCKFSHNYFSYIFKEYTNESPHHYLTRVRLEFAKESMYNGKTNISEAAQASGFCNLQYFSKVFKKTEGIPPSEWLKKIHS